MPGYRSELFLDSKVQLTLWGNVPQFDGIPPLLLETIVMLRVPDRDIDLDVTVEWGRVNGERPHFERPGCQPSPDDPYTTDSVRTTLSRLLDMLAAGEV